LISATNKRDMRERSHTMIVGPGLYLLRYVSTRATDVCPIVRATPSPIDGRGIAIQPLPGRSSDDLTSPGECVLIRAETSGALDVTVFSASPNGSLEAEVRLERIVTSENGKSERHAQTPATLSSEPAVKVLAHVAHRGDCVVEQGEWIGGPDLPISIEGVEIRWANRPANVELRYAASAGTPERGRQQEGRPASLPARAARLRRSPV
jgi:hypothetical protein